MAARGSLALVVFAVALAASPLAGQPVPRELAALAARAGLDQPVAAWCRGEFRSGHRRAFAIAINSAAGAGRYVILDADAKISELGSFTRGADLACYTRAEALKLDDAIGRSDTMHGRITPRWSSTVVCAFVDATRSVCWQYSPADGRFVTVGGWMT